MSRADLPAAWLGTVLYSPIDGAEDHARARRMSSESSAGNYRLVNEATCDCLDVLHSANRSARARGLKTVGLLATAYTMEQDFYVGRLRDVHGLDVTRTQGGVP